MSEDKPICDISNDNRGKFDELWVEGVNVHFEMMDDSTLWIGIYKGNDETAHVWVGADGALRISVNDPA